MWLDVGIGILGCILGAGGAWWYHRRALLARGVLVPQSEVLTQQQAWQARLDDLQAQLEEQAQTAQQQDTSVVANDVTVNFKLALSGLGPL